MEAYPLKVLTEDALCDAFPMWLAVRSGSRGGRRGGEGESEYRHIHFNAVLPSSGCLMSTHLC